MKIDKLLNIKYPIIQGGMAYISTSALAAAVSNAGGLGQVATGGFSPDEIRREIRKTKELTDKPFGVNVVLMHPDVDEIIDIVIDEGVKIITCGAGNPAPYFKKWLEADLIVIPIIASVKMAKKVEALGAKACAFEGAEAGGHIGYLNTFPELPAIVDSVNIPVIAAGGVYTGRHIFAAEVLGASGVQIGTRLLVAKETPTVEAYKKALINADDTDSIVTGITTKMPSRVFKNKLAQRLNEIETSQGDMEEFFNLAEGSGKRAVEGDIEGGSIFCGQGLFYLNRIEGVKEILDNLMKEYKSIRGNFKN
ncbi:NAD(P)H-dependent flavin oxidoreductase [Peptoniphilus catoniae]|uniref:NAD(P)H-dependent flavin oxidoreductase n=1 Tax=Peptoniphilus catoniae TaxID=1660341 RepID=UPI0010FEA43F|nr:nitronate monooxygenase [Peptoniphilus catoniae]